MSKPISTPAPHPDTVQKSHKKEDDSKIQHQLYGLHYDWDGPIHLYENGSFSRPGIDNGDYQLIIKKSLTLKWDRWPTEYLYWDENNNCYLTKDKSFTIYDNTNAKNNALEQNPSENINLCPEIQCLVYEGLCNRINTIATAMATGRPVQLHWSVNDHCPVHFEDIFHPVPNVTVINTTSVGYFSYSVSPNRLCWYYPRNIMQLEHDEFRLRIYNNYRILLEAMKVSSPPPLPQDSLAIFYRHHLPDSEVFDNFHPKILPALEQLRPKAVHVTSDSAEHKQMLVASIESLGLQASINEVPLLQHDLDRNLDNVQGMCTDLLSMSQCQLGIITNSSRSTIPDSLRAYDIQTYYTFDDLCHRHHGRDDLFEQKPLKELVI